jgi:lysophospholipase L1-like esterase
MVSIFDVFNGPNHEEDPREKGWMEGDGYHPNDAGAAAIAEALAAVGFEPNHMLEQ